MINWPREGYKDGPLTSSPEHSHNATHFLLHRFPPLINYTTSKMFLFDLFADLASPFRNPHPQIEDSDDEEVGYTPFVLIHSTLLIRRRKKDEFMSLEDNNSEADPLGVNDCLSAFQTSPLYERHVSDDRSPPFSQRYSAVRRARSTAARYSAYNIPSREQRHAFIRNSRRKEMFVNGVDDAFIPPAKPSIIHPTADLALPSVHADMAAPHVEEHEHLTHIPYDAQSKSDLTIKIPGAVDRLGLQLLESCIVSEQTEEDKEDEDAVDYTTQNCGLTIKIPGLIDRLALRLLGSCNVSEQTETEEGEDVDIDNLSLDGSIASESSFSNSDNIDDDHTSPSCSSSPVPTVAGPDRTSRRKHRRIAAPYHRAEGKPKRKELWADTDIMAGSDVPAFLLGSPASVLRSDRHC
jgi:hypothetical protein